MHIGVIKHAKKPSSQGNGRRLVLSELLCSEVNKRPHQTWFISQRQNRQNMSFAVTVRVQKRRKENPYDSALAHCLLVGSEISESLLSFRSYMEEKSNFLWYLSYVQLYLMWMWQMARQHNLRSSAGSVTVQRARGFKRVQGHRLQVS